jgi:hypothetical protein
MRVATFTFEESGDHTLKKRVNRAHVLPPQEISAVNLSSGTALPPLSLSTASTIPKLKKIRLTLASVQQNCVNNLKVELHHKATDKRATTLYASEQSHQMETSKCQQVRLTS